MTDSSSKMALVTGATSGIGRATALALAADGYRVLAVGRDQPRGGEVVDEMVGNGEFLQAELSTIDGVRNLSHAVRDRVGRLEVLVNNAGATFRAKQLTVDGIERTFALNTVAPFLLTRELASLVAAVEGRVVNIATEVSARTRIEIDDLSDPARYRGFGAYSKSKLALLMVTAEQARRFGHDGITVAAVHPGVVFETRFTSEMPQWMLRLGPLAVRLMGRPTASPEQAAEWIRQAAAGPVTSGTLYFKGDPMRLPPQAEEQGVRNALWDRLVQLTDSA